MDKLKESGVTAQEVEAARKALMHGWLVRLQSNRFVSEQLLTMELSQLGDDYLRQFPERIAEVSIQKLTDCARTRFNFDDAALVVTETNAK